MNEQQSQINNECNVERRKITFSADELATCVVFVDGKHQWFQKRGSKGKMGQGMQVYSVLMLEKVREKNILKCA